MIYSKLAKRRFKKSHFTTIFILLLLSYKLGFKTSVDQRSLHIFLDKNKIKMICLRSKRGLIFIYMKKCKDNIYVKIVFY